MRQLLHWVLPSLNPNDRYHDYFLCSVALELLKGQLSGKLPLFFKFSMVS